MRQNDMIKSFRFLLWTNSILQNLDFGQIVTFKESLKLSIFHKIFLWLLKWPFYWIKVLFRRNGRTFVKRIYHFYNEHRARIWSLMLDLPLGALLPFHLVTTLNATTKFLTLQNWVRRCLQTESTTLFSQLCFDLRHQANR